MTHFRLISLAIAFAATLTLAACNTAPAMPMDSAATRSMVPPDKMARMDAQMKTMQGVHEKMMAAKTPEERSKLMIDHMKTMQDGMAMMGDMKDTHGMVGDMSARQQMMEKRMEMMQIMMKMMMDRLPAMPVK